MTKEWLELKNKLDSVEKIIIFGAGFYGWRIYQKLQYYDYEISFCDNDIKKVGTEIYDRKIVSVDEAVNEISKIILVPHGKYEQSMVDQLEGLLVDKNEYEVCYKSIIPLKKTRIEIQVADHCNLKCRGCNHLSSLATECFIDIKELENDYIRLSEIMKDRISEICLLGGEPLLHEKLVEICELTRRYFKNIKISIITNGLLLLKQSDALWDCCRDNDIVVEITEYPINFDYDACKEHLQKKNVKYRTFSTIHSFLHYPLDICGEQSTMDSFRLCDRANSCILLYDHKLYPCAIPPNIKYYNSAFNEKLQLSDQDGIDIFNDYNKMDILDRLSDPIPFCRYCKISEMQTGEWKRSNMSKGEW